ncbi:MAG: hypothetical protein JO345_31525 [Streptosporangiaceae bacterium]|nr:hypothetical protein [Streptosporangiaceae bacterium]
MTEINHAAAFDATAINAPTTLTRVCNRELVSDAHAVGITHLDVAAILDHRGQTLLISGPAGIDFTRPWQLPATTVPPGQTILDALAVMLDDLFGGIDTLTGYAGHHDNLKPNPRHTGSDPDRDEVIRTFGFVLTVNDPTAICRSPYIPHQWLRRDDELPDHLASTSQALLEAVTIRIAGECTHDHRHRNR